MSSRVFDICGTSGGGSGNLAAVSIPGGNTAGVIGVISSGTVYLAGGDNVTLSQNGQSITISANAGGVNLSLGGNTSGVLGVITSGTAILAGGNNITLSQNGQSVTISAANQSNQTVGLYASSNTYLTSSGTVDARSLTFRGDKSITVGISAGQVAFSVGAYLTTAMASNRGSDFVQATAAFAGTSASGTIASNGISVSIGPYLTTAMASNRGSDFVQATAAFNGTNASGTIASGAISVSVAAPVPIATAVKAVASVGSTGTITRYAPEDHQHAGVAAFAVTNTGNTLGNTRSQVGTFYLAASGAITASQSTGAAGNDTVWLSVATQTNQTLGLYMSSNTTSSVSSGTADARSLTFRGMGIASVGYSGGEVVVSVPAGGGALTNIRLSAGTTSNLLSDVTFADSNGISFGLNASTVTATVKTDYLTNINVSAGTTSNNLSKLTFSNANGVSFGLDGSTITASVSTAPLIQFFEPRPLIYSNITSTAAPAGQGWFFQSVLVPWPGLASGRINMLATFSGTSQGVLKGTTAGNVYASNTSGSRQATVSYVISHAMYTRGAGANSTRLESVWSNTWGAGVFHTVSVSTSNVSQLSINISASINIPGTVGTDGLYTMKTFQASHQQATAASSVCTSAMTSGISSIMNILSGAVVIPVGFNTTLSAGNYWHACAWDLSATTAGSSIDAVWPFAGFVFIPNLGSTQTFRFFGSTVSTNRSQGMVNVAGGYTVGSASPPSPAAFTDLITVASHLAPYINFMQSVAQST